MFIWVFPFIHFGYSKNAKIKVKVVEKLYESLAAFNTKHTLYIVMVKLMHNILPCI